MTDRSRQLEQALQRLLLLQHRQSMLADSVADGLFQQERLVGLLTDIRGRLSDFKRRDEEHSVVIRPSLFATAECEASISSKNAAPAAAARSTRRAGTTSPGEAG